LVRYDQFREMAATNLMSDYIEMINPKTLICTLMKNGEVIDQYKLEQCDKCSLLAKADEFGYQRGQKGEKLLWFCGGCR
jgi:hypothetical protein